MSNPFGPVNYRRVQNPCTGNRFPLISISSLLRRLLSAAKAKPAYPYSTLTGAVINQIVHNNNGKPVIERVYVLSEADSNLPRAFKVSPPFLDKSSVAVNAAGAYAIALMYMVGALDNWLSEKGTAATRAEYERIFSNEFCNWNRWFNAAPEQHKNWPLAVNREFFYRRRVAYKEPLRNDDYYEEYTGEDVAEDSGEEVLEKEAPKKRVLEVSLVAQIPNSPKRRRVDELVTAALDQVDANGKALIDVSKIFDAIQYAEYQAEKIRINLTQLDYDLLAFKAYADDLSDKDPLFKKKVLDQLAKLEHCVGEKWPQLLSFAPGEFK